MARPSLFYCLMRSRGENWSEILWLVTNVQDDLPASMTPCPPLPRPWLHQQAEKFRKRRLDFLLVDRPGGRIDRRARLRIHGSCLVRKMLQVHRVIVLQSVPLCAAHNGTWRQRFRAVLNAPPGSIALASNHGQVGVSSNQLRGPGVRDGGKGKVRSTRATRTPTQPGTHPA